MPTVDFIEENLTPAKRVNHRDEILSLDIARNEKDEILFMGLEWANHNHVVIAYDSDSIGWLRMNKKRYRLTKMGSASIRGPFPKLLGSRRREQ